MQKSESIGTHYLVGDAFTVPPPDNDNNGITWHWQTPAECLQMIRRWKKKVRQEVEADSRLWNCPEHRLTRNIRYAMERCALWQYYKQR